MKLRLSLQLKVSALVAVLLVLVFAAITVIRVDQNRTALRAELIERTNTYAALASRDMATAFSSPAQRPQLGKRLEQLLAVDKNIEGAVLFNTSGQVLRRVGDTSDINSNRSQYTYNTDGNLQTARYRLNNGVVRSVVFQVSDASLQSALAKQLQTIVGLSVLGTLVSTIAVSFIINRSVIRPVRRLSRQAQLISGGDYDSPVKLRRRDEIGRLSADMNRMQQSLKNSSEQLNKLDAAKSEFMMIASHTLRTPITVIKGSLEAIATEPIGPSSQRMLELASVATQRLSSFAEDLLVVSNLEVGQESIPLSPMPVDGMLDTLINYASVLAEQKRISFQADVQPLPEVRIAANRPYLGNAVWNILDNALKFSASGGLIMLDVHAADGQFIVAVTDNGIGIHEAELKKVFDKLHRGTSTEQYDYDGSGIGMYVTKKIIDAHHGSVNVQSTLGHGTTVTITLPLLPTVAL